MSPASRRLLAGAVLLALALGACGPYAQLAQKLDVTARIAGDTWIAAAGPTKAETRILIVGEPDANGAAPFSFASIAGPFVTTLQGSWIEVGSAGATTLLVAHTYTLNQDAGISSAGAQRNDHPYVLQLVVTRSAGQLVVTGNPGLDGTYVGMAEALARLGTTTAQDLTCAFQIANLAVETSEARIIGFGSAAMTQYTTSESFVGTIAGTVGVSVSLHGVTGATTTIRYNDFSDQGGVVISGPQVTDSSLSGNGSMSGIVAFAFAPVTPDPSTVATITGAIDYGNVRIGGGVTSGGFYVVSIDPMGASTVAAVGQVDAVATLSPSVADCLALP